MLAAANILFQRNTDTKIGQQSDPTKYTHVQVAKIIKKNEVKFFMFVFLMHPDY